jgi:peptidoglycan/xylan/chitin deacetylase (PgdA/CDA1 family)
MTTNWIKREPVASRVTRLAGSFGQAQVVALLYRSVVDLSEPELVSLDHIMHCTDVFKKHVELISRDCIPVTMDDVLLFTQGEKELPARAVAVTFDDGYLDSYQPGSPSRDRPGVPAAFDVTVDYVEAGKMSWPSRLRHAFLTTRRKNWSDQHGGMWLLGFNDQHGGAWPLESQQHREEAFLKASDFCAALPGNLQEQFLRAIEAQLDVDRSRHGQGSTMNYDHDGALVVKGHIVGLPTTHPDVAHVSDHQAEIGPLASTRRTERTPGIPIIHFSYPYPALSPRCHAGMVEFSREVEHQIAVAANQGSVRRNAASVA